MSNTVYIEGQNHPLRQFNEELTGKILLIFQGIPVGDHRPKSMKLLAWYRLSTNIYSDMYRLIEKTKGASDYVILYHDGEDFTNKVNGFFIVSTFRP